MKLKLPCALFTALLAGMSGALADDAATGTTVVETVYASADNTYMEEMSGSGGSSLAVSVPHVTWSQSYDFPYRPISVGSVLGEATLAIVTPEGAEEKTVVCTLANMFIGGWGWGVNGVDALDPHSGTVYVGKEATLEVGYGVSGDTSRTQLNIGSSSNYAETGAEGTLIVDGGTVRAGNPNVGLSWDSKGNLHVLNGGSLTAVYSGGNTGLLALGYYGNSSGMMTVDGASTVTAEYYTIVGYGRDGSATGSMAVSGESTANLGSFLFVGHSNGSVGDVTVDNSTLTAGSTYVGYSGTETNGSLTVQNGGSATLGQTLLGYGSGTSGSIVVDGGTLTASSAWIGYSGSGELTVSNGGEVNLGQTVLGYSEGASGIINVDGGKLTAGSTFIGYNGSGELTVSNGGVVNLAYMDVVGSVSLAQSSLLNVSGDVDVEASGAVLLSDNSTMTVGGNMTVADGGIVSVDATSTLTVTGHYDIQGSAGIEVGANSEMSSGTMSNTDTVSISLKDNSSFSVNEYTNAGDTTTVVAEASTSCYFGSIELNSGKVVLEGSGDFVLGEMAEGGEATSSTVFTVSGQSADDASSTCIDISGIEVEEDGSGGSFTLAESTAFTLNFMDETLASIAASSEETFTLTLIYGYEGFILDDESLEALLASTTYNIDKMTAEAALMTLDLDDELEAPTVTYSDFVVTAAEYAIEDNNLVWRGTVRNNAIPEPTTATLSLLALVGLAARRRRR